ncbi:unnamed protein product [Lampetra planeri]
MLLTGRPSPWARVTDSRACPQRSAPTAAPPLPPPTRGYLSGAERRRARRERQRRGLEAASWVSTTSSASVAAAVKDPASCVTPGAGGALCPSFRASLPRRPR